MELTKMYLYGWSITTDLSKSFDVLQTRLNIEHTNISHKYLMNKNIPLTIYSSCSALLTIKHLITEYRTHVG